MRTPSSLRRVAARVAALARFGSALRLRRAHSCSPGPGLSVGLSRASRPVDLGRPGVGARRERSPCPVSSCRRQRGPAEGECRRRSLRAEPRERSEPHSAQRGGGAQPPSGRTPGAARRWCAASGGPGSALTWRTGRPATRMVGFLGFGKAVPSCPTSRSPRSRAPSSAPDPSGRIRRDGQRPRGHLRARQRPDVRHRPRP